MQIGIELFGEPPLAIGGQLTPYVSAVLEKLLGSIVLRCRSEADAFTSSISTIIHGGQHRDAPVHCRRERRDGCLSATGACGRHVPVMMQRAPFEVVERDIYFCRSGELSVVTPCALESRYLSLLARAAEAP